MSDKASLRDLCPPVLPPLVRTGALARHGRAYWIVGPVSSRPKWATMFGCVGHSYSRTYVAQVSPGCRAIPYSRSVPRPNGREGRAHGGALGG